MSINLGVGSSSGLDTEALIQQALAPDQAELEDLQEKLEINVAKVDTWESLTSQLVSFAAKINVLRSEGTTGNTLFYDKTLATANSAVVTGTAATSAITGDYNISISQLARNNVIYGSQNPSFTLSGNIVLNGATIDVDGLTTLQSVANGINNATGFDDGHEVTATVIDDRLVLQSNSGKGHLIYSENGVFPSAGDANFEALGIINTTSSSSSSAKYTDEKASTDTFAAGAASFTLNGVVINYDADDTLADIADTINGSTGFTSGTVKAVLITESGGNQVLALQNLTSTNTISISGDTGNFVTGTNIDTNTGYAPTNSAQTSQDAELTINGIEIESSSNTLTNVISGVTLNAIGVGTDINVNVSHDTETIKEKINEFIDSYNETRELIQQIRQIKLEDDDDFGVFYSDSLMRGLYNEIRTLTTFGVQMGDHDTWSGATVTLNSEVTPDSTTISLDGLGGTEIRAGTCFRIDGDDTYTVYEVLNTETYSEGDNNVSVRVKPPIESSTNLPAGASVKVYNYSLSQFGVESAEDESASLAGYLQVDETALDIALENNFDELRTVFTRTDPYNNPYSPDPETRTFDTSSVGVARRLYIYLDRQTKLSAYANVTRSIDDIKLPSLEDKSERIREQIERLQERMEAKEQQLKVEFADLEQTIAQAQNNSEYLKGLSSGGS